MGERNKNCCSLSLAHTVERACRPTGSGQEACSTTPYLLGLTSGSWGISLTTTLPHLTTLYKGARGIVIQEPWQCTPQVTTCCRPVSGRWQVHCLRHRVDTRRKHSCGRSMHCTRCVHATESSNESWTYCTSSNYPLTLMGLCSSLVCKVSEKGFRSRDWRSWE